MTKKKVPEVKNPDCEPATKGYVKCLIRRTAQHTHEMRGDCLFTLAFAILTWITTFTMYLCTFSINPDTVRVANQWMIPIFLVSVLSTTVVIDAFRTSDLHTCSNYDNTNYKIVGKYKPPECTKHDCED